MNSKRDFQQQKLENLTVSIPKSLGKETGLVNISPCQSKLKCYGILLPAMPASRNKVIHGCWFLSSDFCKTSWNFLHDPVCPKTGPVLSKNLVRSVLKPGPFCPGTWSVLSLDVVRFVLKRGPFCLDRFVHGPFCPSIRDITDHGQNGSRTKRTTAGQNGPR